MGIHRILSRGLRRFLPAQSGVAAVEFALVLPIMLLLYIGMVEGSTLITMDRKVQTVSGAVGDLVARSDGALTTSELGNIVKIAGGIMTPYSGTGLQQTVSQIYVDNYDKATVDWSKHYVGQALQSTGAYKKGDAYSLPAPILAISRGQYVIVTECSLAYTPLYGIVFNKAVNLYRQNFYIPRFREQIKLN